MNEFYEKMREDLQRQEQPLLRGLTTRAVVAESHDEQTLRAWVATLRERPLPKESTFKLASFIYEQVQERIPAEFRREAADNVAEYVKNVEAASDDLGAEVFLAWGGHRGDYRDVGLALLRHPDPSIRRVALSYSGLFLRRPDFDLLLQFRNDPEISETITMGGPLRYTLRDFALRVLERLTGLPVENADDCFDDRPEGHVYYRSWSSFLNKYEAYKRHG